MGVSKPSEDGVICQRDQRETLALLPAAIETGAHQNNSTSYHYVLFVCVCASVFENQERNTTMRENDMARQNNKLDIMNYNTQGAIQHP